MNFYSLFMAKHSTNTMQEQNYQTVPIWQIQSTELNGRDTIGQIYVDGIKHNLLSGFSIDAIELHLRNGQYECLSGNHRLEAYRQLYSAGYKDFEEIFAKISV